MSTWKLEPMKPATESLPTSAPAVISCRNPATREPLGEVPVDSPEQVLATVERARRAQRTWRQTSFEQRRELLRRLLAYTVSHKDHLCELVQRDSGKTREHALVGEIWPTCEKFRWMIQNGERYLRPEPVSSGLLLHKRAWLEYHPLGVVAAILPWNYPYQNIVNPLIPALMAGNAIVVKPSEWVAWSSAQIVAELRQVIASAGHDPELLQAVQGFGPTGEALVRAPIDTLLFIGSVRNGRRVVEASAERITPLVMELGGKDAFIVCDDAALEQAAHAAMAGCFINCGQNCVASERILVQDGIYEAFERRVLELVRPLRQGAGPGGEVDVGAIVTPLQLAVIEQAVAGAVAQGARVLVGGQRVRNEQGDYYAPTILAGVTPEMDIARDEVFGPIMLLMRVRDDDHAVEVANGVSYGLSSSIFSRNQHRARQLAARLEAGMSAINEFGGITYMVQGLTFGGVKASGYGRMNGRDGLRSMCSTRAVVADRFPIHAPSRVFPVSRRDYGIFSGVIELIYGQSLSQRWQGLRKLLRGGR